jgi:hypothetical protein
MARATMVNLGFNMFTVSSVCVPWAGTGFLCGVDKIHLALRALDFYYVTGCEHIE